MRSWYRKLKFGQKVLFVLLLMILLPVFALSSLEFYYFNYILTKKTNDYLKNLASVTLSKIESTVSDIENVAFYINGNDIVQASLKREETVLSDRQEYYTLYRDIRDVLASYALFRQEINAINLRSETGKEYTYTKTRYGKRIDLTDYIRNENQYWTVAEDHIVLIKKLFAYPIQESLGYIMLDVSRDSMYNVISDIELSGEGKVFLVNEEGCILVSEPAGLTGVHFLYYAERVIRKLAEHTASHPSVIGFQIDNETKHYDGYSETVQNGFVEYLKETFETPEQLNRSLYLAYWSNSIHSWEDFPDMRGCIHGGLAGLYDRYRRDLVTKYLHRQADLMREYAEEGQFITHNLDFEWKKFGADIAQDGYSYGVQRSVHHADVAKFLDLPGTDIYHPTQDQLTGAEIAFGGDEIRSLKRENYLVLETQAQAFKYWTPYPGQLRLHAYSHLASGAMGMMYWNWHSIHNGYETYWRGVLSHDLSTNPVYEGTAAIGQEWQRIGAERLVLHKKNEVALVIDNASLSAFQWFPIDRDVSYNDVVRYMYDSLYELNVECDVVFADELEPDRYRIIVTPALYCAEEELLNRLDTFVKQGGVLISSFRSFVADKNCSVYPDMQPHILNTCFGISYNQFTEPGTATVNGYPVKAWADLLVAKEAAVLAHYEHRYWNRYAAVTENAYGKGYAYYLGCYADKTVLKDIYRKALTTVSMDCNPDDISDILWEAPVIVRSGKNGAGRNVHYVFHYSSQETEINCPYRKVMDLLTGKVYEQGDIISLKDWDVVVLEEQRCTRQGVTDYDKESDITGV